MIWVELPQEMTIRCACGVEVTLELEGGQYQTAYRGTCPSCGLRWLLEALVSDEEDDEDLPGTA